MTLVANSIPFHAAGFKAANREHRVPAGGVPAHHSLSPTRGSDSNGEKETPH